MNKLLIAALFLPALATADKSDFEICQSISKYAGMVMESRQLGVDMAKTYESVKDDPLMSGIVRDAYSSPQYTGDDFRERRIASFKSDWFLVCINARKAK
tara:strand:+ start:3532 stop:3831 length:300 start_codon:yes stop_codon:yes gene_type:complete